MTKQFLSILFFIGFTLQISAQSTASDWTLSDIDGNSHHLYDVLESGKGAIIDFSTTWCGPCWSYHNTGILEDMYEDYGPTGSDEIMVYFLESDGGTNTSCLYGPSGCVGGTQGDWVTGTEYPIIDLMGSDLSIVNNYGVTAYPTLFAVGPNKKKYNIGQASYNTWVDWMIGSFQMDATAVVNDIPCIGGVGSIELTAVNGYGDIDYDWSNGASGPIATDLPLGVYYCTLTDEHNYDKVVGPFTVSQGGTSTLFVIPEIEEGPSCPGYANGAIGINSNVIDDSFAWSNGDSGGFISNLQEGTYTVTVTDNSNGCSITETFEIQDPPAIQATSSTIDAGCLGNEGSIEISGSGGTGTLYYSIGDGFSEESTFDGLAKGIYEIEISDDNNCFEDFNVEVQGPDIMVSMANNEDTLTCLALQAELTSIGSSSGASVKYFWSNGDGDEVGKEDTIYVDSPDDYILYVLDTLSGCDAYDTVSVMANVATPVLTGSENVTLNCLIESTSLLATTEDTLGLESYAWTTMDGTIEDDASELSIDVDMPGTYTFTAVNLTSGCESQFDIAIDQNLDTPDINIDSPDELNCENESVSLNGNSMTGSMDETYQWTTTNGLIEGDDDVLNIDVSAAGEYFLTAVNNLSGCMSSTSVVVAANEDLPVIAAAVSNTLDCNNGESTISVDGDGSYDYTWYDVDGNALGNDTTYDVDKAGVYLVEAVNASNGCTTSQTIEVSEDFEAPTANIDGNLAICSGNETTLCADVSEGANFQWEVNGEILTDQCITIAEVADVRLFAINDNGCDASAESSISVDNSLDNVSISGDTEVCEGDVATWCVDDAFAGQIQWMNAAGEVISMESCISTDLAGEYTANFRTDLGCTTSLSGSVTINSIPSVEITEAYEVNCLNLELDLDVAHLMEEGISSIDWTSTDGTIVSDEDFKPTVSSAGIYTASFVTDAGCLGSFDVNVTEYFNYAESSFASSADYETVSFTDMSSGDPSSWSWDFGNGTSSNDQNPTITYDVSGIYTVCLEVENECGKNQMCEDIDVFVPLPLTINEQYTDVVCYGENNGSISLDIMGGVEEYIIAWTGPNGFTSDQASLTDLGPGIYEYNLTDQINNEWSNSFEILEPAEMFIQGASINDDYDSEGVGSIDIDFVGGIAPYEYEWSNGATTEDITDLNEGEYTIVITDANGCEFSQTFEVMNELPSDLDELGLTDLAVYPNPVSTELTITASSLTAMERTIEIVDLQGQLVFKQQLKENINLVINTEMWTAGLYMLKVSNASTSFSERIIKQ